jgi:signal transduction histidine kinase
MIRLENLSMRRKIMGLIMGTSLVVLLVASMIFSIGHLLTYQRSVVAELESLSRVIAQSLVAPMAFSDHAAAKDALSTLDLRPGILSAEIYDANATLFAQHLDAGAYGTLSRSDGLPVLDPAVLRKGITTNELKLMEGHVDLQVPIILDGDVIGALVLRSDLDALFGTIKTFLLLALAILFLMTAFTLVLASHLEAIVSRPLYDLLGTAQRVSKQQDFSLRAPVSGRDEIGELAKGFNAMLARIEDHDQTLRKAWQQAESASRSKSEFLANMSHELRTPLNAIIGFSEIIKGEVLGPLGTPRYRDYAQDILESGQHLLSVINDILDLSKIEAGEFDLNDDAIDIGNLVSQVVRLLHERAEKAHQTLAVEIEPDFPLLFVDQRVIKQCLINLLSNAIKFSPEAGHVKLHVGRCADGRAALTITDNGIGMKPEEIPDVLRPFAQLESPFSKRHDGTGLGLPLTQSFIRAHGGDMEIESQEGKGTKITLYLPAQRLISPNRPKKRSAG